MNACLNAVSVDDQEAMMLSLATGILKREGLTEWLEQQIRTKS